MSETYKFTIVENKQSEGQQYDLVYTLNPPRLRSVGRVNTIYEMHELMSKSLEIIAPRRDTPPTPLYSISGFTIDKSIQDYGLYFAPDFPDFLIPKTVPDNYQSSPISTRNIITWGVVRSEPGTVSQDTPFRGVRELKPRTREFITLYNEYGRKRLVNLDETLIKSVKDKYGYLRMKAQCFDNLVQYNIWGKSNYEVERLTEWFMDEYMDNYIGMFREAGIVQMYFDRRVRDDTILQMKNGYHVRSVLYYIRTERVKPEIITPIRQINLNITLENLQKLREVDEGYNIESQYDKLISKWIQMNQLGG